MRTIFIAAALAAPVASQPVAVSFGGGCAPGSYSTSALTIAGTPGWLTVHSTFPQPSDYAHFLCVGTQSPWLTLPSCGCTVHTNVLWMQEQHWFQYPAALSGQSCTVQLLIIPRLWGWPGIYLVPDLSGCQEAGFGFRLSNGYRVQLP